MLWLILRNFLLVMSKSMIDRMMGGTKPHSSLSREIRMVLNNIFWNSWDRNSWAKLSSPINGLPQMPPFMV